jgi:hypothetical protein
LGEAEMKTAITLLMGLMIPTALLAQNRIVHGKLTVFNRYPVQNVKVTTKKAKTSITTDSLGYLAIVCHEKDVIRIHPKIFESVTKKVNPETDSLNINLIFIDSKANREKAVGYGYMKEEDLMYAVDHLQQEYNDFVLFSLFGIAALLISPR